MSIRNTRDSYGSVAKWFHWLIFGLIVVMLILGFSMGAIPDKALRGEIVNIHKCIGLTILALMILRVIWTLMNPKPKMPFEMPSLQKFAAYLVHNLLYIVIIAMPISGWVMSSAAGYPPHFFHLFTMGLPMAKNKALASAAGEVHEILAWTIIVLVSVHILASIKHHFIDHDNILIRMMPNKEL